MHINKPKILIICYSNLGSDPRVLRQIEAAKPEFYVITAGLSASGAEDEFIDLTTTRKAPFHWGYPLIIRKIISAFLILKEQVLKVMPDVYYNSSYWTNEKEKHFQKLKQKYVHIILSNDIDTLPLAVRLKQMLGVKLIFDAHEYSPLQFENNPVWSKFSQPFTYFLCKKYLKYVDLMYTVCKGIADKYHAEFKIEGIKVITNAATYADIQPQPVNPHKIRLIHHGMASRGRALEEMIKMMEYADEKYYMDFMLVKSPYDTAYFNELKQMAASNKRISFLPPVRFEEIIPLTNQYDLSVILLQPNTFNLKHTLPNKFFEAIQARLGILIGPSPEMQAYLKEYDLGMSSEDFSGESLGELLNLLDAEEIKKFKENAHKCALVLSANRNMEIIKMDLLNYMDKDVSRQNMQNN